MPWVRRDPSRRQLTWVSKEEAAEVGVAAGPVTPEAAVSVYRDDRQKPSAAVGMIAVSVQEKVLAGEIPNRDELMMLASVSAADLCVSPRPGLRAVGSKLLTQAVSVEDRNARHRETLAAQERREARIQAAREERIEVYRQRAELMKLQRQRIQAELRGLELERPAGAAGGGMPNPRPRLPR